MLIVAPGRSLLNLKKKSRLWEYYNTAVDHLTAGLDSQSIPHCYSIQLMIQQFLLPTGSAN
jgi:hypothetical protein